MEIKYTNFDLDKRIFGEYELSAIVDETGGFIYQNIYDPKKVNFNEKLKVKWFLKLGYKQNKKIIFDMVDELELDDNLLDKKMGVLSSSELLKVLIIKAMASRNKTIILDSIDTVFNWRDLNAVLKVVKNHLPETQKNALFLVANVDNIFAQANRYIVSKDGEIIFNSSKIKDLPVKPKIMEFVDRANKRGAKLDYYKEPSDLLKAIYRSVK